jgi:hypothetical protein
MQTDHGGLQAREAALERGDSILAAAEKVVVVFGREQVRVRPQRGLFAAQEVGGRVVVEAKVERGGARDFGRAVVEFFDGGEAGGHGLRGGDGRGGWLEGVVVELLRRAKAR